MTQQQQNRNIRKLAEERGVALYSSLEYAALAREIADLIDEKDCVVWSERDGGIAWSALGLINKPHIGTSGTIYSISPPADPSVIQYRNLLAKKLSEKNIRLRFITLDGEIQRQDFSEKQTDGFPAKKGFVHRILNQFIESLENRSVAREANPAIEEEIPTRGLAKLERWIDSGGDSPFLIPVSERDSSVSPGRPFSSPDAALLKESIGRIDSLYLLDAKISLFERFHLAECAACAGLVPLIVIRTGECLNTVALLEPIRIKNLRVILSLKGSWNELAPFSGDPDLAILCPASVQDGLGALKWLAKSEGSGIIFESTIGAYPERSVFRSAWETGEGVKFRESLKGSAGSVLIIVPGDMTAVAGKAADRLARDNISVTVMSMRFLQPLDIRKIADAIAAADVSIAAESGDFTGDLRHRLSRIFVERADTGLLMVPQGIDGLKLAETASDKLREKRIRRTVDDVKADRWR